MQTKYTGKEKIMFNGEELELSSMIQVEGEEQMQTIKINCTAKDFLKLEALTIFQGNLKELSKENYEKLKGKILEQGFISPIHVWKSPDGENYILDGTQRFNTLSIMQKEGFEIPELPCTFIQADSYKIASEILLSLVSQYGKVTEEGLYEFASTHEIDLSSLKDEYVELH